jgi:dTDP-4-amino-4,6-dideoxy-D-glucose transaminase
MRIPIVRPKFPPLGQIEADFRYCLQSGKVTNNDIHVREFERQLTEYLGAPTLCFNNGQTALITMLMAADIGPGDEVICPSFTFCGTAHAIAMLGAKPVFADIDSGTLTLDLDSVWDCLTRRTKAILGVDVYGICCDYENITEMAHDNGCLALFDSAPAFGSVVGSKWTASFGDAQIFSFHATKPFSTMEGGALCSRNPRIFEAARRIRDFGQDESKNCTHVGLNGKMMEVCALIGLEHLKAWNDDTQRRWYNAISYRDGLEQIKGVRIFRFDHYPIWTYMPILVDRRDEVLRTLNANGIGARRYYDACHLMKPYARGQSLPVTEHVASQVIALPMLPYMTHAEIAYICETLEGAMK